MDRCDSDCRILCNHQAHTIYPFFPFFPNYTSNMQKQEPLILTERRYKSAFEKSKRENSSLQERINLQEKQIKNLKRKLNKKDSIMDLIKKLFWIKTTKQWNNANCPRPLRQQANKRLLINMLEDWKSIAEIINQTWWKRENVVDFIRIHWLKSLVKSRK